MDTSRIGRALPASLHQAIADLLPTRLDFYEHWLRPDNLRTGAIGLAPLTAVLSFLRSEGESYGLVTARAGQYAAEWSVDGLSRTRRALIRTLPAPLRARVVVRSAAAMIRRTYGGSRATVRRRRRVCSVEVKGSVFCQVREPTGTPLCGFYTAVIDRMLEIFGLQATVEVSRCRATGGEGCIVSVALRSTRDSSQPSAEG